MRVAITKASRLPQGSFLGAWNGISAPHLASYIWRAWQNDGVPWPDRVVLGQVIQANSGQAPSRQSLKLAGAPDHIPAFVVNQVCASGMQAIASACRMIEMDGGTIWAGGMESLSSAPYMWPRQTNGRPGIPPIHDSLMFDGLQDASSNTIMGAIADCTARESGVTRAIQEEFAYQSFENSKKAIRDKMFDHELILIEGGLTSDEPITKIKADKFFTLKPAFQSDGTITAATSSSLADGAASVILSENNDQAIAYVCGIANTAGAPKDFTKAPIKAIDSLLDRTGWKISDVDLFEINEAFATVPIMAMQHFGIERNRINIHGGACALGHPLGASGARIIVTLIHALKQTGGKKGIAALCVGGGEGMALAIELP